LKFFKISFIGSGNVASTLCREFYQKGHTILHIVSRNERTGRKISDSCKATWSDDPVLPDDTELIIIAVPDHRLPEVAERIRCNRSVIVAHTAGSVGLDVFPPHVENKGVFYPLQTFSGNRRPDLSFVPFFIEGSDKDCTDTLMTLAGSISKSVYLSDTAHRRLLHLAAIFVSNFTNHLQTLGKDISAKANVPFDVFYPLITETISKSIELGPENSQTGPAVRYDLNTIEKHLDLLSYSPELRNIYDLMTRSIMNYYNKK
jgi:predicted short-subunit dehydrogenase-like oxidoreductase (DUF2520 family)